ncbi:Nucleoside-diphosphate-sugar epimerase [Chitinophaga eiseniae]|uniref:Nucleoside-diphosphate-sugar epimerase n=1 Tax=Chitinophaga eiseniae TaxID=634771 RepID=A0A1T4NZT1_9BACT|nr:aldehyde reductase [Chitinophaga eiseniae]SJZ84890.1 Nucleoside-diphosphate-sugar epimerase [Chitinophaga eiseniae]
MNNKRVLLTGATGFLGSHTIIQLLEKGYEVTGTLRDMGRAGAIREMIAQHTPHTHRLTFAQATLEEKDIWYELTRQIDFVQHVASPFPRELPKREEDLIIPAREGVLNVMRAASANKVKRFVLTSSSSAVLYGKTPQQLDKVMTEADWSNVHHAKDITPYFKSKTIAEKAAWDFIQSDGTGMELVTVLPGAILGPVLEKDFGTSANIVIKMLDGSMPAVPKIGFDIVDVRSVADALIRAMETPAAANNRYLVTAGHVTMKEVALILKKAYPGRKLPSRELPDFLVRLAALFDTTLGPILPDLGKRRRLDAGKAKRELQWKQISTQEAVLSCAKSIFETGIVH